MALSEAAAATLASLRDVPKSTACENCLATLLGVDRYDVLKSIRELIRVGRILCTYGGCGICHERRLLARIRSERSPSID